METDTTTAATAAIVGQASCLPDGAPAAADIVDIQPPSGGAINRPVKSGDKSPHSIKIPPPYYGVRRLVAAFDGGIYSPAPSATAAPIVTAVDAGVVVRLSVTTRCQLRCAYCLPAGGAGGSDKWQVPSDKESAARGGGENAVREAHGADAESTRLPLDTCHLPLATSAAGCSELPADDLVRLVALIHDVRPVRRVRFTGGEPLLRRDLPELISDTAALGIPELALTTNGQLLAARAAALRRAGVRRVNVSLDSL
ncbi:MAG: radical SAM protein, partial [Opitutaceae bacterium]|nr:radical SAM protein [Opitutaceae bacterium]